MKIWAKIPRSQRLLDLIQPEILPRRRHWVRSCDSNHVKVKSTKAQKILENFLRQQATCACE